MVLHVLQNLNSIQEKLSAIGQNVNLRLAHTSALKPLQIMLIKNFLIINEMDTFWRLINNKFTNNV